jgi:predicted amidohydrolase YtcJ
MYLLYTNGYIHTLNDRQPLVSALLISKDRIIYCGDEKDINLPENLTQKINLNGLHIYPAFTDCHTHVASVALGKEHIRLDDCSSLSETLKSISDQITDTGAESWILGGGWNANRWSDEFPHKLQLDQITTDRPIALYNKDGHTQWLNSKALETVGFYKMDSDPPGGKLGRDSDNELTGIVYEKACDIVNSFAEEVSYEQLQRCMEKLYPEMYAMGITSVHSCESLGIWALFQKMVLQNDLNLRICMHPPVEDADKFVDGGFCSGFGNEWFRLGGLKYFVDGSLGSQTAEMFENYAGLEHAGIEVLTENELIDKLHYTTERGFSATIHAIGDKANHKTLNAFEQVKEASEKYGLRNRIEHAQILLDKDIRRFAEQKVIASMQPLHIADDVKISKKYLGERASNAYRIGSLIDSGAKVVFGSDMPIADPDPIKGILSAHNRHYLLDKNEPQLNESECISIAKAIRGYTSEAAYASYEENLKGTIEAGKLADFIGLPIDLEKAAEDELYEAKVNLTVLGGEVVFDKND